MTICVAFPLIVPLKCVYRGRIIRDYFKEIEKQEKIMDLEEKKIIINRININSSTDRSDCLSRLYNFFQAPIVKFLYDKILYFIFLIMYCYVILCDFHPIEQADESPTTLSMNIGVLEVILIIWVLSIIIDRLHNVSSIFCILNYQKIN